MSDQRTAEQAKQQYVSVMGAELGNQFHVMWQQLAWLHHKWAAFAELYGDSPDTIQLLNRCAPLFFRITQDSLLDDILLHIARLTDSATTGRKTNLTIWRFPDLIDVARDQGRVRKLCEAAELACQSCREIRHKQLAHLDLDHVLGRTLSPLPGISRSEVRQALDALQNVLNGVTIAYGLGESRFDSHGALGGSKSLIEYLRAGRASKDAEIEARRQGRATRPT